MSRTTTVASCKSFSRSTSTLLFSPSKSRHTDEGDPSRSPRRENKALAGSNHAEDESSSSPTPTEIHRWTFTRAAIAPCFIRDVFEMRDSGSRGMEFFWLGRIPCRTVCIVGLVVGVQVWEKRTVYTIDDNTAVVDCAHAHPQAAPPSPVKQKRQENVTSKTINKVPGSSLSNYLPRAAPTTTYVAPSKRAAAELPSPPKPFARVGQPVCVVGRVVNRHDTRLILVDEISVCASFNDEPSHWLAVAGLHHTAYHPSESLPPFIPPPLPSRAIDHAQLQPFNRPDSPRKPRNKEHVADPGTPTSVCSSVASTNTSPSTVASTSSPASITGVNAQSPIRLRHPARLHTRELTVHTLRIYIKHYMDNAPPPSQPRPHRVRARSTSPSPIPLSSQAKSDALATPTKSTRPRAVHDSDATPRPSRSRPLELGHASRAALSSDVDDDTDDDESQPSVENDDRVYGYTLSHLRRVPELSLLARRVVHAEAHRRAKEERKRAKAKAEVEGRKPRNKSTSGAQEAGDAVSAQESNTTTAAAMKRLFRQAIRTLFQDGNIVLWDGPVRPPPPPALDPLLPSSFSSALWKANSSTASTSASMSNSRSLRSFPAYDEWDDSDAPLSEPAPGEEAYVPLTPAYFARVLERAILRIAAAAAAPANSGRAPQRSLIDRLRAQDAGMGAGPGPPPGPTAVELLAWLRNSDGRWAHVGLWSVEEALEWGRGEGRLWCVGKGRWEVCG